MASSSTSTLECTPWESESDSKRVKAVSEEVKQPEVKQVKTDFEVKRLKGVSEKSELKQLKADLLKQLKADFLAARNRARHERSVVKTLVTPYAKFLREHDEKKIRESIATESDEDEPFRSASSSESDDDPINETDYVLWRAHAATRPSRSLRHSEPVSGAAQLPLPDEDEPFRSESSSESDDEPFNEADYVRVNESDCEGTSDSEAAATTSKR